MKDDTAIICANCGKRFEIKLPKFCSRECSDKGKSYRGGAFKDPEFAKKAQSLSVKSRNAKKT